jgi:hypothetical protein
LKTLKASRELRYKQLCIPGPLACACPALARLLMLLLLMAPGMPPKPPIAEVLPLAVRP